MSSAMRFGRVEKVYLIGIGGSGMCGIAEVLLNLGFGVSGSDLADSGAVRRLEKLGARVFRGHERGRVSGNDVVVVSTAIPSNNPEIEEARELRIPVIPRAEMLGELMRMKYAVAVSGSHGKTSTTSMIATVLTRCGLDPTVVIGGRLGMFGGNAKLGKGEVLVAEADESDGSFLRLYPTLAIVTGIDQEHLDHYGSFDAVKRAFVEFLQKVPFYGQVIACLDDPGVREILPLLDRRVVTYGLTTQADFRAVGFEQEGFETRFSCRRGDRPPTTVRLRTPGRHQVQNALAALAAAEELGVSPGRAAEAIEAFPGADRRMELKGESAGILVVDDYGHHPHEIVVTLEALREAVGDRRIVVLFQPHRYSRLELLFDEFTRAFYRSDLLFLTELYAAGETPREGISSARLAEAVRRHGHQNVTFAGDLEASIAALTARVEPGDVVLTLGAGSVGSASGEILSRLDQRQAKAGGKP